MITADTINEIMQWIVLVIILSTSHIHNKTLAHIIKALDALIDYDYSREANY